MNRFLAGGLAAATVVLAAAAGWALFGPAPAPAPRPAAAPAASSVERYGRQVPGALAYVDTQPKLARQGYVVTYTAQDPALQVGSGGDPAPLQAAWQQRFCTDELRGRMRADGVAVVTGKVVDGSGRTQYVADCLVDQAQQKTGPGGPLL